MSAHCPSNAEVKNWVKTQCSALKPDNKYKKYNAQFESGKFYGCRPQANFKFDSVSISNNGYSVTCTYGDVNSGNNPNVLSLTRLSPPNTFTPFSDNNWTDTDSGPVCGTGIASDPSNDPSKCTYSS